MEGLVLLIAGMIGAVGAILPLLAEGLALLAAGVADLLASLTLSLVSPRTVKPQAMQTDATAASGSTPARPPTKTAAKFASADAVLRIRRWSRRVLIWSGGLFAATLVVVLLVNQFFFGALVRFGARDLPQRHGVTLQFAEADGNLFTGRVHLTQAHVKRPQHPSATFDVTIDDIEADIDVWRLLKREVALEDVTAKGIRGTYTRVGPKPEQLPKRGYMIQRLQIVDVELIWTDATRPNGPFEMVLEVDKLETTPFRSTWAAFDVLFRSNGSGRIAGGPFTLSTREIPHGRETEWHAQDVPVTLAAAYLGGPFRWITAGTIDVDVTDHWRLPDGDADIQMDWGLTFRNVTAAAPDDANAALRVAAGPVVNYFNAHAEEVPLRLEVTVSKGEFTGRMSPPLELITGVVADAAVKELAEKMGVAKEKIQEQGQEFMDKARGLFKQGEGKE